MSSSLQPHGLQHAGLPCPLSSPRLCQNSCLSNWWCIPPSHPLSPSSPPAFSLSQHQGIFQWVGCSSQVAKVLDLQLQHQSSNEYSVLISLALIGLISLQSKELSRVSSSTIVWSHQFFGTCVYVCNIYIYTYSYANKSGFFVLM